MTQVEQVGIVVIGRNEAEHLEASLSSALIASPFIVYVDSGSTDDSVEIANRLGVVVVRLDATTPFTAARAYNAGVSQLLTVKSSIKYVQFLDGDARLMPGWLKVAYQAIDANPDVAVVCGRRQEKSISRSVYNLFADMEWDTPIGEVDECGPESMMRLSQYQAVDGFNESLIAGEEPEICFRMRLQGMKILRIDASSSRHDMNMMSLRQWWRRSRRGGYAFAEQAWIHRYNPGRYCQKQCFRIWLWAFVLPFAGIALAPLTHGFSLFLIVLGYMSNLFKTYLWVQRERHYSSYKAWIYSSFCLLIKFPELYGQTEFIFFRLLRRHRPLIEYKTT